MSEQLDWKRAESYLETVEKNYNDMIGVPGVEPRFAIVYVIQPLRVRFNRGERSAELYNEIMALQ